ncbi:MAG: hypothetical protein JNK05_31525 [Myxococcales bacterium]|nr:hypothetical protein [Myxococcales bacterium]
MNSNPVYAALRRALWLALAVAPAACGAVVFPNDGGRPDGGGDGGATCTDPSTGRVLRVGESNGARCPCTCTEMGLLCASCPPPQTCALSDGRRIEVGQTTIAPDGCNSCICQSDGTLACTEIACPDGGPPDADVPDATSCAPIIRTTVPNCESTVTYPCGIPGGPVRSGDPRCAMLCTGAGNPGITPGYCTGGPGANSVTCGICGVGRFTDGLDASACDGGDDAARSFGAWLARGAQVEGIAAMAFDRLADELASFGAPASLVDGARTSAGHEREHCAAMTELAARWGHDVSLASASAFGSRTLADIVIENAGEGCVRETLGAVVMAYQSQHAQDRAVREALAKIAFEEQAHSAWSWALDAWARSVVDHETLAAMDAARDRVLDELVRSMATVDPSEELAREAGMPSARAVSAMISGLSASLWRASN